MYSCIYVYMKRERDQQRERVVQGNEGSFVEIKGAFAMKKGSIVEIWASLLRCKAFLWR